jgi:hypothetical protein
MKKAVGFLLKIDINKMKAAISPFLYNTLDISGLVPLLALLD